MTALKLWPGILLAVIASLGSAYALQAGTNILVKEVPSSVTLTLAAQCGDQNGDETVNVFDVIIDLQIIVGQAEPTSSQAILSDLNRDGFINVFDVIFALQHIVGLIPTLDQCGVSAP